MSTVSRRALLAGVGAASAGSLLTSCAGFTGQPPGGAAVGPNTVTFTTWASDAEKAAYTKLIQRFEAAHRGAKVQANFVPYAQMFTNIDAQLAAGNAPDVFRAGYGQIGGYAKQGALLDLTRALGSEKQRFVPAFWQAVSYQGKPFGVPQQTDTSAIAVNTSLAAGIGALPDSLDKAWTWEEFAGVLGALRSRLPASTYPFAYNWQLAGSPRWLNWLFATGGRLLDTGLRRSAIVSAEGAKALDYTKAFFTNNWVPANSSVKSNAYADTTWLAATTAMVSAGNFLLPEFTNAKFDWRVTYLPRDRRGADDLGGNGLVATAGARNPDLAAEFLSFMVRDDAMTAFCAESLELPTLTSLIGRDLGWQVPKKVMPVFVDQATTITAADVAQLTVPASATITTVLTDQLEAAFRQGQSTAATLKNIAAAVDKAVR